MTDDLVESLRLANRGFLDWIRNNRQRNLAAFEALEPGSTVKIYWPDGTLRWQGTREDALEVLF